MARCTKVLALSEAVWPKLYDLYEPLARLFLQQKDIQSLDYKGFSNSETGDSETKSKFGDPCTDTGILLGSLKKEYYLQSAPSAQVIRIGLKNNIRVRQCARVRR